MSALRNRHHKVMFRDLKVIMFKISLKFENKMAHPLENFPVGKLSSPVLWGHLGPPSIRSDPFTPSSPMTITMPNFILIKTTYTTGLNLKKKKKSIVMDN